MQKGKVKIPKIKRFITVSTLILFIVAMAIGGVAQAKSLYVLSDTNSSDAPIQAYDIQGNQIVYQQTVVTGFGWGSVGLTIDTDSKTLFMTQEGLGTIKKIDAVTFADLGEVTAPGADDLAGIVVDQDKGLVYAVDRDWSQQPTTLHVYDLSFSPQLQVTLPHGAVGIALDETNDLLYVANFSRTVRYYDTATWTEQGSFDVSHTSGRGAVGIAVDPILGYVYTGAWTGDNLLSIYDVNTTTETTLDVGCGVVGLAVDIATHLLYMTTSSCDDIRVYDTSSFPFVLTDQISLEGDPAGICVPGKDISYEPTIIVYPNPCYPNQEQQITMKGLPTIATVYIYTVAGELVRMLETSNGTVTWNLRNDAGKSVAEGIYVYYVPEAPGEKIGKIAIIKN